MNHHLFSRGVIAAALFLATPLCFAYQPLMTDDTGTQGEAGNQLEYRFYRGNGVNVTSTSQYVSFSRGLTDTLDVYAGTSYVRYHYDYSGKTVSGRGSPVLGLKWRFFESESGKSSLGIRPVVALPVSAESEAKGLGVGRTSWGLMGIYTQQVSFGEFHVNVTSSRLRSRDPAVDPDQKNVSLSAAPVWVVNEQWRLALDVAFTRSRTGEDTYRLREAELGVVYSPMTDLDFALGIVRSTVRSADGWHAMMSAATAGVTWRFK